MTLYTSYFIEVLKSFNTNHTILFENNKSITAGELLNSSYNLAMAMANCGVDKGHKVVVAVKPGVEFLQVIYANMMLRTITSIIDPEMGRDNYNAKLKQFAPDHCVVDSKLILLNEHPILKNLALKINKSIPFFPRINNCKLFTTGSKLPIIQKHKNISSLLKTKHSQILLQPASDKEDFLVTYTSGTLNEPKGVVHSYFSLFNSIQQLTKLLQNNCDEIIATHLPHFALLGINAGIKVYLWNNKLNAKQKIDFITKNKISTLFGPPSDFISLIFYLSQNKLKLPSCIKNIYLGSAPIYNSFLSKLIPLTENVKITCLYGMTENLMVSFQDGHRKLSESIDGDLVGKPFPNVDIKIANDGEIIINSNQLYSRYWNEEQTKNDHYSGDIGKIDNTGRLILLGRKKDMIIRGNFNIYPGLYESTINKIDGVKEAVMIGIYNNNKSDEEVILVVDRTENMNEKELMEKLRYGKLSIDKEALPDKIIFMKIPHSGRQNKIDRKQLVNTINSVYK